MGKNEYIKLQRKLLKEQQEVTTNQKDYRNKVFAAGFIAGLLAAVTVMTLFSQMKSSKETSAPVPGIATSSATQATPLSIPSGIQINTTQTTPPGLPQ